MQFWWCSSLFFSFYLNTGSDCPPRVTGNLPCFPSRSKAMKKAISLSSRLLVPDNQMALGYLKIKIPTQQHPGKNADMMSPLPASPQCPYHLSITSHPKSACVHCLGQTLASWVCMQPCCLLASSLWPPPSWRGSPRLQTCLLGSPPDFSASTSNKQCSLAPLQNLSMGRLLHDLSQSNNTRKSLYKKGVFLLQFRYSSNASYKPRLPSQTHLYKGSSTY